MKILKTSDEAAQYKTVSGWVSRNNKFYGEDEQMARYDGCTHTTCRECGAIINKSYCLCDNCSFQSLYKRYKEYTFKEWDKETPVYDIASQQYFFSEDDIESYLDNSPLLKQDLMLVYCEEIKYSDLSYEYFTDDLAEDQELPNIIKEKIDELNLLTSKLRTNTWEQTNIRTEI